MNVGELADAVVIVEEVLDDDTGDVVDHAARARMDRDAPLVVVVDGNAYEVTHLVMDSGQAQLHVGAPAVLSHKLTGEPKPTAAAQLDERLSKLEALLAQQQSGG